MVAPVAHPRRPALADAHEPALLQPLERLADRVPAGLELLAQPSFRRQTHRRPRSARRGCPPAAARGSGPTASYWLDQSSSLVVPVTSLRRNCTETRVRVVSARTALYGRSPDDRRRAGNGVRGRGGDPAAALRRRGHRLRRRRRRSPGRRRRARRHACTPRGARTGADRGHLVRRQALRPAGQGTRGRVDAALGRRGADRLPAPRQAHRDRPGGAAAGALRGRRAVRDRRGPGAGVPDGRPEPEAHERGDPLVERAALDPRAAPPARPARAGVAGAADRHRVRRPRARRRPLPSVRADQRVRRGLHDRGHDRPRGGRAPRQRRPRPRRGHPRAERGGARRLDLPARPRSRHRRGEAPRRPATGRHAAAGHVRRRPDPPRGRRRRRLGVPAADRGARGRTGGDDPPPARRRAGPEAREARRPDPGRAGDGRRRRSAGRDRSAARRRRGAPRRPAPRAPRPRRPPPPPPRPRRRLPAQRHRAVRPLSRPPPRLRPAPRSSSPPPSSGPPSRRRSRRGSRSSPAAPAPARPPRSA